MIHITPVKGIQTAEGGNVNRSEWGGLHAPQAVDESAKRLVIMLVFTHVEDGTMLESDLSNT